MFGCMPRLMLTVGTIGISALTVADAIFKYFAITHLTDGRSERLLPFIDFTVHRNPGITGDIAIPLWIVIPLTIGILLFLVDRASTTYRKKPITFFGILAVIAGATNNLIDRIINGFTTDYLMFFSTSIINLSDVVIIGGALIIMVYNANNPQAQCTLIPSSPPIHQYGVVSRMFRSIVRTFRNTSHR